LIFRRLPSLLLKLRSGPHLDCYEDSFHVLHNISSSTLIFSVRMLKITFLFVNFLLLQSMYLLMALRESLFMSIPSILYQFLQLNFALQYLIFLRAFCFVFKFAFDVLDLLKP
jgi:hypothetical protein